MRNPQLRRGVAVVVAVGGLLLGFAAQAPAESGSSGSASGRIGAAGGSTSAEATSAAAATMGGGRGRTVTLITGDVVSYYEADGKPMASVVSTAPRPGGQPVSFFTMGERDSVTVIPTDALQLVRSGQLDKELFNVKYLVENGYADQAMKKLPLIISYSATKSARQLDAAGSALPGTSPATPLTSINAASTRVAKADTDQLWSRLTGGVHSAGPATDLRAGIEKVYLDGRVHADLAESVPQIGAPEAWAAGYDGAGVKVAVLDTGIDTDHPDFKDRVVESKNFTEEPSIKDGFGHGTHVASIIAGSGAASGGKYRGVAPKADLMIGKVLDSTGSGYYSGIIEGMQWAAAGGARVINMSLGGGYEPDAMSEAVDSLSAQYDHTLFAIAAGNSGPYAGSVTSPGLADSALTVAAVDKSDKIATFSSRGPRAGDFGLKPDIAAPGVNIVAARASGTNLGPRVGDDYTTLSGTSMATPHVAGAVALLAEEHPDWTGQQLKAVLTSSAKDDGYGAYAQGAGRVDVKRAITQQIYADHSIDFSTYDAGSQPATKSLTYSNVSDQAVTLDLAYAATPRGSDTDAGVLNGPATVTVPAHGSQSVEVEFAPTADSDPGWYEGSVVATDSSGTQVRTAVDANLLPRLQDVDVHIKAPKGAHDVYVSSVFMRIDDRIDLGNGVYPDPGLDSTTQLPAGPWSLHTAVLWTDDNGEANLALASKTEIDVEGPTSVTLDLSKAREVKVDTPKESVPVVGLQGLMQVRDGGVSYILPTAVVSYPNQHAWVLPIEKPSLGTVSSQNISLYANRPITMATTGRGGTTLHPWYQAYGGSSYTNNEPTMLDGTGQAEVVDAGHGTVADFEGIDVRDKIALVDMTDLCPPTGCTDTALDRVQNAKAAGARAVIGYGSRLSPFLGTRTTTGWQYWYPMPTLALSEAEGSALASRLDRGAVRVSYEGHAHPTYLYPLAFQADDRVEAEHRVSARQLYRIDDQLYGDHDAVATPGWTVTLPDGVQAGLSAPVHLRTQSSVTEYVGPVNRGVFWNRTFSNLDQFLNGVVPQANAFDVFAKAGSRTDRWFAAPQVPGALPTSDDELASPAFQSQCAAMCRGDDTILAMPQYVGNDPNTWISSVGFMDRYDAMDFHLYADGHEVPLLTRIFQVWFFQFPFATFDVPPAAHDYRLVVDTPAAWNSMDYPERMTSEFEFSSERPDPGTLFDGCQLSIWTYTGNRCDPVGFLGLRFDAGVDLDNTVPAGKSRTLTVIGYHPDDDDPVKFRSVSLQVSYDDGDHWQDARVNRRGDGTATAQITPPTHGTTGAVSFKVRATDNDGRTSSQTVIRGYGIR